MNQITRMIQSARWLQFRFRDVISWGRERCNGTSAFPDSFMIFILLFYSCFTLISFSYFSAMTLFYSVFTICLFILDGALRLRVWITRRYFPLICYSFNCQQILFIYSLPPENICFCLLYSQRDWTRLDPFFCVFLPMLRVQNQKV
jgi:hypothetical protein